MALILSIETATSVCSVALHESGTLITSKEINSDKSHSQLLLYYIEEVLTEAKKSKNELSAIAVSEGPGSYTGLRIGLSTAKGLCYALDKPLIAINTLDAMGLLINETKEMHYAPMIDARRMEVYTALYDAENKRVLEPCSMIIDEHSFAEHLKSNKIMVYGNGAEKCRGVMVHDNVIFCEASPTAKTVGVLAYKKFKEDKFEDVAYFEPNYLKEFYSPPSKKNQLLQNLVAKL